MEKLLEDLKEAMTEEQDEYHGALPESSYESYCRGRVDMLRSVLNLVASYKDGFR